MKTSISQTISILRFPLCVVIVMIHSNIALYNASANQFTSIHILSNYIIGDICFYSLALFFFISGFLLFREGNFNLDIFKKKIIHRVYSLLIPYILWNLICFIMIFILQMPPKIVFYICYHNTIIKARHNLIYRQLQK